MKPLPSMPTWVRSARRAFLRAWRPRWPRTTPVPVSPRPGELGLPLHLIARLDELRRKHRHAALVSGGSLALGLVSGCLLLQGLADWWFGLPWLARAVLLGLDLLAFAWIYRVLIHPPLRVPLDLVDMARLVERHFPELDQRLLTATELVNDNGLSTSGSPQLTARVLADAARRAAPLPLQSILPRWRVVLPAAVAGALVSLALVLGIIGGDASASLLQRIVLLNPPRPTKTVVEPVTRHIYVAKGDPVTLRARARRLRPEAGRVELNLIHGTTAGDTREAKETAPRVFSVTVPSAQASFRYRFLLNDGRGEDFTVTVKDPPVVIGLEVEAIRPPYTGLARVRLDPAELKILAGSDLAIRATASTRLRSATLIQHGQPGSIAARLDPTGTRIEVSLPIPAKELTGWSLHLVDEHGITSRNDTIYPIEIVPDKPPKIEWIWPRAKRLTITRQAQANWKINAGDDLGLASLALRFRALPQDATPNASPPLPIKESLALAQPPADDVFQHPLDFQRQPSVWQIGRTIEYWAEASDKNNITGPGMSATPRQQLRIVAPEEKMAELYGRSRSRATAITALAGKHAEASAEIEEALRRETPQPIPPHP